MELPRRPASVDSADVDALCNHLAVVFAFIELVLAATTSDDPRRADQDSL